MRAAASSHSDPRRTPAWATEVAGLELSEGRAPWGVGRGWSGGLRGRGGQGGQHGVGCQLGVASLAPAGRHSRNPYSELPAATTGSRGVRGLGQTRLLSGLTQGAGETALGPWGPLCDLGLRALGLRGTALCPRPFAHSTSA